MAKGAYIKSHLDSTMLLSMSALNLYVSEIE